MTKAAIYDGLNFFNKMTAARAANMVKIYSSFYISKWLKRPVQWGLPFSIAIEPTTSCNLRCPECPSGLRSFSRPTGMLQEDFFRNTIDKSNKHLQYLTFYFQGEPYLNPKFLDMVAYASKRNIYTTTSTNAHYLNDENAEKTVRSGLDRLIISIDGTTQETYQSYRIGGKLDKVIEGAKNIIHWKNKLGSKTPYVIFQFLVVKPNEHQVEQVKELAAEIGVDEVKYKTAQVYNYENGNPLIPENEKFSRYKRQADGTYKIKNAISNECWKMWHSCVITWDGAVVPCCFDKDAKHQFGHLQEKSLQEIWQNEQYYNFRSSLLRSRKEIDICKNCSEGTKVWA